MDNNWGDLLGQLVMHRRTKKRGIIVSIDEKRMSVSFSDETSTYLFPDAFADTLILKDKDLQRQFEGLSCDSNFAAFQHQYSRAVEEEINYIRQTGGKKYRIIDGERLTRDPDRFLYSFETDSDLHFPDGTAIKIWLSERMIYGSIVSCEEFAIILQAEENLGEFVPSAEFTSEQWYLLEALNDRVNSLHVENSSIAYELACRGRLEIDYTKRISKGQDNALKAAFSQPITIIWGPPGTGKTTVLSKIALEAMNNGQRVLMLSYSNVSVDGAMLRVASMARFPSGQVLRYGYPRMTELLEKEDLTSYGYVLNRDPGLKEEYDELVQQKKALKRNERVEIDKRIKKIRAHLLEEEKKQIQKAAFVATTVSKAIADSAVYGQKFDVVIFDEASMAYVSQVVFAASLAKSHFCCFGDFRQLPAIVQNRADTVLTTDIFEHTGIVEAVENGYCHRWLVMLNYQYRMHPEIASFVSHEMYGDSLKTSDGIYEKRQRIAEMKPMPRHAMSMFDLSNTYSVCKKTMDGSRINVMSAMFSVALAEKFAGAYGVAIITPYSAQSRLILAMIRDLRKKNKRFQSVTSATVHQFQGSEKAVVIFDAVDCFRMPYPGVLLTSLKNNTANRLFNVAITRTQGKFILLANKSYLYSKGLSKNLMLYNALHEMGKQMAVTAGNELLGAFDSKGEVKAELYVGDRDEIDSWEKYLSDIVEAEKEIVIEMPGPIDEDEDAISDLIEVLTAREQQNVEISIRTAANVSIPKALDSFVKTEDYVTTPLTVIDRKVIWFGEPLSDADFISEGEIIPTKYFPCLRLCGEITARLLKEFLEL